MTRIGAVGLVRRTALTVVVVGSLALATIDPFTLQRNKKRTSHVTLRVIGNTAKLRRRIEFSPNSRCGSRAIPETS